ncbi:hypothetical protein HDE_12103 [Halotydeus destructor]|nr:hypothetical protein HDE_12103 [Halotydeus destructor]
MSQEPSTSVDLKSKKSKPWLKLIWFLFCSLGCILHTDLVTEAYRKHQFISIVEREYLEVVKPPAISLCFQFVDIVNTTLPEMTNYLHVNKLIPDVQENPDERLLVTETELLENVTMGYDAMGSGSRAADSPSTASPANCTRTKVPKPGGHQPSRPARKNGWFKSPKPGSPIPKAGHLNDHEAVHQPGYKEKNGHTPDATQATGDTMVSVSSTHAPPVSTFVSASKRVDPYAWNKFQKENQQKKCDYKRNFFKNFKFPPTKTPGRGKRSSDTLEEPELEDPSYLREVNIKELVYPLHELVVNVSIRNPKTLQTDRVDKLQWTAFVKDSVDFYELQGKALVCYKVPLAKLIGQPYSKNSFGHLKTPFLKFDINRANRIDFVELYVHDEDILPLDEDHRIVLYPNTSYTLGYQEHVYMFDEFFNNRPCKQYAIGRKHEVARCIARKKSEQACNSQFQDKDCYMTSFRPVLARRVDKSELTISVGLLLRMNRSKTTMIPKTSLSEFLTLLSGIIGFWFGVNLITFHGISKFVIKTCQRGAGH